MDVQSALSQTALSHSLHRGGDHPPNNYYYWNKKIVQWTIR